MQEVEMTSVDTDAHLYSSRRPFTPPDHWLVSTQIDLRSFVEAAL
jgi:ubiquitin-protein ligase E3 C